MTSWADNTMSKQDFSCMQQDALRRVREMQHQAMTNLEKTHSTFAQQQNFASEPVIDTPPETIHTQQNNEQVQHNPQNQNTRNGNWANNRGYIGPNQNFGRPPNGHNQERKSPLNLLNGLFSKKGEGKGGISDIIDGLIPKRDGDSPISKILDALDLDTEKLIIIVLIVLLLNDGADYTLILALGYILL